MAERLAQWYVFGVAASLLPLLVDALVRLDDGRPAGLNAVLGHGELLLVTGAIAFPAFGMVVMSDVSRVLRGCFGGLAVLTEILVASLYASINREVRVSNPHSVAVQSVVLFLVMLAIGTVCVAVARTEATL